MTEYIEREDAIKAAKHAWAKGLEPSQYIEIIPAADVAEVRHGRWVDLCFREWHCSECGDGYCYDEKPNYCPSCGAKMDLEE